MVWILCLSLSLAMLAAAVVSAVLIAKRKYKPDRVLSPYYVLFGGVCLSVFLALLPVYHTTLALSSARGWKTILFALHNMFQVFSLDADRSVITDARKALEDCGSGLSGIYTVYLSVVYVCGPVLTFGFLASLLKNFSALFRYILHFRSEVYAFSDLNERSLALAGDIREHHPKAALVFTGVSFSSEQSASGLVEQAKGLRAICFKKGILSVSFDHHDREAPITFFTIGEDEALNAEQGLKLIERFRGRANTKLLVFSKGVEGELLLAQADKGLMKVYRINDIRSRINQMLYTEGEEIFKSAKAQADGKRKIGAVIVGLGKFGTEMLKALSWFCQMDGYTLEIDAFELDPGAEDRLSAAAPDLLSAEYNGRQVPGEAEYIIRIHSGIDVRSRAFYDAVRELESTTFVFIALGADRENLQAALSLRAIYERMKINPLIQAVIFNTAQNAALNKITNYSQQPYNIRFFGDIGTSYSEAVILNSRLEADALQRHLKWGKEEEFWNYEYNYNSSVATAIHIKTRIALERADGLPPDEPMTPERIETLACLEHRRWNAYMRSEGYVYSGSREISSRNNLAKMHNSLVSYYALTEEERAKDRRIVKLQ